MNIFHCQEYLFIAGEYTEYVTHKGKNTHKTCQVWMKK